MQLEGLLSSKQAQLHEMGATEQTWLEDAQKLRDAVANTLGALGKAPQMHSLHSLMHSLLHSLLRTVWLQLGIFEHWMFA